MIALSIEGDSLRMLSFSGRQIRSWESIPLSPYHVRGGFVSNPEAVGQVIGEALAERGLMRERALFAFPSIGSACSILNVPNKLRRSQFGDVISREARRVMSFSAEASYLYWQLLPKGSFEERKAWVLTVPREPLLKLMKACHLAKLKLRAIDLTAVALSRVVGQKEAIIVHCEPNRLETVILVDWVPQFIRSTLLGESEEFATELEEPTAEVLRQIPYTISYYNDTHRDAPLDPEVPVYLTGSLALDIELAEKVSAVTERPVAELEPPLSCPPDFPLPLYAVNLGLMLKTVRG